MMWNSLTPEWYAQQLLNRFKINEPPIDVKKIVSELGIRYREEELGDVGIEGSLMRRGDKAIIVINSSVVYDGRRNFTTAHELGHYCIKEHQEDKYDCSKLDMENFSLAHKRIEAEANMFAAELLMPKHIFLKVIRGKPFNFKTIENISETFGVSLSAAALRYTTHSGERCAVIFSSNGNILWGKSSDIFKYTIRNKLQEQSYAYDAFYTKTPLPSGFEQVYPFAWIADSNVPDDLNVQEQSTYFNNINSVLSLIKIVYSEQEEDELYED